VNNGHVCVIRFGCAPSDDRVDLLSVCTHIIFMKHATAGVTLMLAGIVLILAGILLVVFPPLLSIIVAAFLIFAGVMAISVARYNRKYQRHFENPTIEFFFRYFFRY
jgi:uncharacterized membrane protein YphA (DoxX/SURF4 family)